MKCHILFSEKNKKNISKCLLLKILPRVLSVKIVLNLKLHNRITIKIKRTCQMANHKVCEKENMFFIPKS